MVIEWHLGMDLNGCDRDGTIEVDDKATEEEIEEIVRQEVFQYIDWSWRRAPN